jgi:hypothetical protein
MGMSRFLLDSFMGLQAKWFLPGPQCRIQA